MPYNLTNMNGTLFFDAYQDNTGNDELFKSDGTEAGTVRVADINPGLLAPTFTTPPSLTALCTSSPMMEATAANCGAVMARPLARNWWPI